MSKENSRVKRMTATFSQIKQISEPPSQLFQSGFGERKWLRKHGKQGFISFTDDALIELRKYFQSLDQIGDGSIGVEQLEDPFIAFGLSENRQQIQDLIKSVDLDGSGTIEFNQFLEIMNNIKRGKSSEFNKNSAIVDFFNKLSSGTLGEGFDKNMNFRLNVSQYRRKKLMESIMGKSPEIKEKGTKILQNFKKQVISNSLMKESLNESKKSNIFVYGFELKNKAYK